MLGSGQAEIGCFGVLLHRLGVNLARMELSGQVQQRTQGVFSREIALAVLLLLARRCMLRALPAATSTAEVAVVIKGTDVCMLAYFPGCVSFCPMPAFINLFCL